MRSRDEIGKHVIGVAGCGSMGLPMARRLLGAGFEVIGYDVRPIDEFGDFASRMCASPRDFAARADVVISVVRDRAQTFELCFDDQRVFAGETRPNALIVSSTLAPAHVHEVAARLPGDTILVDAPMSGAPIAAQEGTLTFMLGGEAADVARFAPLFAAMGSRAVHVGERAAGMTAKVLNNYVASASVVAVRRVLEAARRLGLDRARLLAEVMAHSSGGTWYGTQFDRISWSHEGYAPGNTIGILEKDTTCALDAFASAGLSTEALDEAVLEGLRALEPYA